MCNYSTGDKADVIAAPDDGGTRTLAHGGFSGGARGRLGATAIHFCTPWQRDELTGGAYAVYGPGQLSQIRPMLQQPHGLIAFAGDHLDDDHGYMEGAVASGEAAALWLISQDPTTGRSHVSITQDELRTADGHSGRILLFP